MENLKTIVLTISDCWYLSRSIFKLPNRNICLKDSFESLCNKVEMQLLLKPPLWNTECLYMQPIIRSVVLDHMFQLSHFEQEASVLREHLPPSRFFLKSPFFLWWSWLKCQVFMNFSSRSHFLKARCENITC